MPCGGVDSKFLSQPAPCARPAHPTNLRTSPQPPLCLLLRRRRAESATIPFLLPRKNGAANPNRRSDVLRDGSDSLCPNPWAGSAWHPRMPCATDAASRADGDLGVGERIHRHGSVEHAWDDARERLRGHPDRYGRWPTARGQRVHAVRLKRRGRCGRESSRVDSSGNDALGIRRDRGIGRGE